MLLICSSNHSKLLIMALTILELCDDIKTETKFAIKIRFSFSTFITYLSMEVNKGNESDNIEKN